ncbi:hypothetical protein FRC08_008167 [Ceratobasidium sp. 394]|nr:hypothetical protein FRC08_008167 [Ceratobasidium sp. 394]
MSTVTGSTPHSESPAKVPFYRRWRRTDNEFVHASLVSSRAILQRASTWSSHANREGIHIMRFHSEWRDLSCSVEQWYQIQLKRSREARSTTRFTTIQHRRTLDSPFFHEFLLIPLIDGSYYRVERTGVGSNIDAITLYGCTACDMIEWFPAVKYEALALDRPSSLITEVQFPFEFDILDILAICYSIQKHSRARNYSLQCFNCYFFCCAILSILTRRVVDLENMVNSGRWEELLGRLFDEMSVFSGSPLLPEAKKYSILWVCAALQPQNPLSGMVVVETLRGALCAKPTASKAIRKSLVDMLWLHNVNRLLMENLEATVDLGVEQLCSRLLQPSSVTANPERGRDGHKLVEKLYAHRYAAYASKAGTAFQQTKSVVSHQCRELPARTCLVASLCGPPLGFGMGLIHGMSYPRSHGYDRLKLGLKVACATSRVGFWIVLGRMEAASGFCSDLGRDANEIDLVHVNGFITDVFETLESSDSPNKNEFPSTMVRMLAQRKNDWDGLRYSTKALLCDSLARLVKNEAVSHGGTLTLTRTSDMVRTPEKVNIWAFQECIREHIKTYATRVEENHLGLSGAIFRSVETAISGVWKSMPGGFGAKRHCA